jgi:HSP20 family protein
MGTITTRKPSALRSPFRGLAPRPWLDELFDQFLAGRDEEVRDVMAATMDVAETEQAFEVKMDLPGVRSEDVDIQIDNNTLTVRGRREEEHEEQDEQKQFHRVERFSGSFARSVVLPSSINEDETAAEFEDGVLKIVIPKMEDARPRKINIKS